MRKLIGALCLVSVIFTSMTVKAEEREEKEDGSMPMVLEDVSLSDRKVVIGDIVYQLSLNLMVVGDEVSNTEFALKEGRKVRIELDSQNANNEIRTINYIELVDD